MLTAPGSAAAELLDLARAGNPRPAIDWVLGLVAAGMAVDEIITEVLAPVQREVGARWEANLCSVADEHVATAAIDGALGALAFHIPALPEPRGRLLVACAEGEFHSLPARMGAELLRTDGWEVTFLGGSLPADDLQRYAAVGEPDAVVVSCTMSSALPGARRSFAAVAHLGMDAIAAGAAFGRDDVRARRLGASGWIGPSTDDVTASVLRTWEPAATPTPAEVFALELAAHDLEQSCDRAISGHLREMSTWSPVQVECTRTAIRHIVDHLATSIDLGDDEIFTAFVEWQGDVLGKRRVTPAVLDESLDVIGELVAVAGMSEAARLCALGRSWSRER